MVITSGLVNVELPMDSNDAVEENNKSEGKTLLVVFGRGYSEYLQILLSILSLSMLLGTHRDSVGGSAVVGDVRWTGTFGVNVDLVAKSHCSVELIRTEDILVCSCLLYFQKIMLFVNKFDAGAGDHG